MPIYEYVCRACGQPSEILQKLSEPDARKCPLCGKLALTRQVSAAGFRLKGGGWYETDFKSDNKKNLVNDSAPVVADSTEKAPATPAAAPAAKPAAKDTKEKPATKGKAASTPK
jgi:putative FmdB family regulatory protein